MYRQSRKCIALILSVILVSILTGCGTEKNTFMDYRPEIAASVSESAEDKSGYALEYLSKDVCVIPKKEQSPKNSDSIMTAGGSLIVNDTTNTMLFSKNIYKKMYPASITKIVTALVTLKYANMEDMVTISHEAANITEYGARLCGFKEGDQIQMSQLFSAFLVYSGNDAGIAIAEHIAGSVDAFADMMNREMQELGASGSHFVNPHGLHDKEHYTTVYDLYLVFHALLQYDTFLETIHLPSVKIKYTDAQGTKKKVTFQSTDRYLTGTAKAPAGLTVVGGKTGTTQAAGSCLILYTKDSSENDYISIVLQAGDSNSLYVQMNQLLSYVSKQNNG